MAFKNCKDKTIIDMTITERKKHAQDLLMSEISKIGYSMEDIPKEEFDIIMKHIKQQGDRIGKMFGYDGMWFS